MSRRTIYKYSGSREVRELLQSVFAMELLCPGNALWIVSPWISDVPILDNRAGAFNAMEPSWPNTMISLVDVLTTVAGLGTTVVIHTRSGASAGMVDKLRRRSDIEHLPLTVFERDATLHTKGILGAGYLLSGSMNITYNGIEILDEMLHYSTAPEDIQEARLEFERLSQEPAGS